MALHAALAKRTQHVAPKAWASASKAGTCPDDVSVGKLEGKGGWGLAATGQTGRRSKRRLGSRPGQSPLHLHLNILTSLTKS